MTSQGETLQPTPGECLTLDAGLKETRVPTCPTTAILSAHVCTMCQEHTGTFQVPQGGGQVQGSPATGIQLLNVHLRKKLRWSPGYFGGSDVDLSWLQLSGYVTWSNSQGHARDQHDALCQVNGDGHRRQEQDTGRAFLPDHPAPR